MGALPQYTITTASGRQLNLANPDPEQIVLEDIAAALSKICRFGAQTNEFYSVAQHAVLVRCLVGEAGRPDLGMAALHHDSHEAFAGDMPTPLKKLIASETNVYKSVCRRLDIAIGRALDLFWPAEGSADERAVKAADDLAFEMEAARLVPKANPRPTRNDVASLESPLDPGAAEDAFLAAHQAARGVSGRLR